MKNLINKIKKRREDLERGIPVVDDFPQVRACRIGFLLACEKGLEKIEHLCNR